MRLSTSASLHLQRRTATSQEAAWKQTILNVTLIIYAYNRKILTSDQVVLDPESFHLFIYSISFLIFLNSGGFIAGHEKPYASDSEKIIYHPLSYVGILITARFHCDTLKKFKLPVVQSLN